METSFIHEGCCPLQFLYRPMELDLERCISGPGRFPQLLVETAILKDMLSGLGGFTAGAEGGGSNSEFLKHVFIEPVVLSPESEYGYLISSREKL